LLGVAVGGRTTTGAAGADRGAGSGARTIGAANEGEGSDPTVFGPVEQPDIAIAPVNSNRVFVAIHGSQRWKSN
jgi:N-acetylmuramic acid 6-phosphate (MurNAc-6-P) etherase